MVYRTPQAAPASRIEPERRGQVMGMFCRDCGSTYPLHRARHSGRALYGKDHIASPCPHEGEAFDEAEPWWEPAVTVLPELAEPEAAETSEPTA